MSEIDLYRYVTAYSLNVCSISANYCVSDFLKEALSYCTTFFEAVDNDALSGLHLFEYSNILLNICRPAESLTLQHIAKITLHSQHL
jgi:hypothetical protein